jgi:polysaccharide pyruvyl transferase CsaB
MYRILISGYYGFNNIGDESILTAVTESLREGLRDIDITVLSSDPEGTAKRYGVRSRNRRSLLSIVRSVAGCDLLISGGGSLLQDVTSKRSIIYYLFIMWLAGLFGKDYFVYSEGIGPINLQRNRKWTAKILKKASGIVVRDEKSREFLGEIGVDPNKVVVTADPVLKLKPAGLSEGRRILDTEGCLFETKGSFKAESGNAAENAERPTVVGMAIKERKTDSSFLEEIATAAERLIRERNAKIVLIPFHFSEDMPVASELAKRLKARGLGDSVCAVSHKYLAEEMMSIIGNTDILVGVRLHSLIHAAIMGMPMIGISYDPKINSFMHSVGRKAMCSVYDFTAADFLEEYDRVMADREAITAKVTERVKSLKASLDTNEKMIREIMSRKG